MSNIPGNIPDQAKIQMQSVIQQNVEEVALKRLSKSEAKPCKVVVKTPV